MRSVTADNLVARGVISDEAFSGLSDEDIDKLCGEVCFDTATFRRRINVRDRWSQLIISHLFLEHIAIEFLEQEFVNKGVVRIDRWGLLQKVELLRALGVLSEYLFLPIVKINALRNKAAHSYKFSVTSRETVDLISLVPNSVLEEKSGRATFKDALYMTVALFEYERRIAENRSLQRRKSAAKLRLALKPFDEVLASKAPE